MSGYRSSISVRQLARCINAPRAPGEPRPFATIERYWNDPAYAAQLDAERAVEQRKLNAMLDKSARRAREKRTTHNQED